MRFLVVDGDEASLKSLELTLREHTAFGIDSGEEAMSLAKLYDYDAIVLADTPDASIATVVRYLRRNKVRTPVLAMLEHYNALQTITLLDSGADAVMWKGTGTDLLLASLNALVRRSVGLAESIATAGPLKINFSSKTCEVAGAPLHLTGKEYQMLELLMLRRGAVQSKEAFLNYLYGGMDEPELKIIDVFICKLRRKLAMAGADGLVKTVWGRGYLIDRDEVAEQVDTPPTRSNPVGDVLNVAHPVAVSSSTAKRLAAS